MLFVFEAQAAHAVQLDVTCAGTSTVTMSPGLTYTLQTIHYDQTVIYSPCLSTDSTLTAGINEFSEDVLGSCLIPLYFTSGSFVLYWNNGNNSTFTYTETVAIVAGQVVLTRTGTITAGQFQGDTAVRLTITSV